MSDREPAAGDLGLVQAFVNSVDLEPGVEELRDPNTLQAWLVAKGLMGSDEPVHETDLKNAVAVREAMRGVIGGNSGPRGYPLDPAPPTAAATPPRPRLRFSAGGRPPLPPAPPRRDLGQDAERRLLRSAATKVQTDRPMDARELLLGEAFLAQRVEPVLIRLATADCPDVAGALPEHRAQRREVELRVVRQDHDVRRTVDRDLAHRLVGPFNNELVSLRKPLRRGELRARVDDRDAISHQLRQAVQGDRDMDRTDDHEVGRAPEGLDENVAVSPRQLRACRGALDQLRLAADQIGPERRRFVAL